MTADGPAPRRRGPRRADAAGTGPAAADAPEPRLPGVTDDGAAPRTAVPRPRGDAPPAAPADERARWLREQRPPHWG